MVLNLNLRVGIPEAAGLAVLGATVGALMGGAGSGGLDLAAGVGALIGAALPLAIVLLPRLARSNAR